MEEMLTASQEARLVGRALSRVSHARRDERHPVNGPSAVRQGRHVRVPAEAALAYWESVRRRPGPLPSEPYRLAGVTRAQWRAMEDLAEGKAISGLLMRRLEGNGLADGKGLTARGAEIVRRVRSVQK